MELRTYLKMLVRGWWLVLLAFGAALGVSLFLSSRTMPVYQVNARFVISPNPDLVKADNLIYSLDTLNRRSIIATFAEFLNSRSNFEAAGQLLNLPPEALANYTVTTVALPDANVLQLFIEGPDPLAAIQLAESIGRITIAQVQKNYQVYNMAVLDPPTAPSGPIHPQPVRDALLAGALGLVAGAGLALLRGILTAPQNNIDQNQIPASWSAQYFRRRTEEELDLDDAEPVSLGVIQLCGLQGRPLSLPSASINHLIPQIAAILQAELRGKDVVARWNDLGFVILFPATPKTSAQHTMQSIQQAFSRPILDEASHKAISLQPQTVVISREGNETAAQLLGRTDLVIQSLRNPFINSEN